MKRLIKLFNKYESDGAKFSDCSSEYEILPVLVDDQAGLAELVQYAKKFGFEITDDHYTIEQPQYGYRSNTVTDAIQLTETKTVGWREKTEINYWLAFITIEIGGTLKPTETTGNKIDQATAYEIIDSQEYGVSAVGEHVDGHAVLVKSGWNFFHEMPLLGYDLDSFFESIDCEQDNQGFEDDTLSCHKCGKFDDCDNGYEYNHRYTDGERLGINCGCWNDHCESEYIEFCDDPNKCIELATAEKLAKSENIEHVERFIGGMVDGRGGYFAGESVREGNPESVLKEYKEKFPDDQFLFTHDGSGQFQSYFSIWRVLA